MHLKTLSRNLVETQLGGGKGNLGCVIKTQFTVFPYAHISTILLIYRQRLFCLRTH